MSSGHSRQAQSAPPAADSAAPAGASTRLYRRFWRWHFYAAFLVIPFVLMQSTTGTLYLWHAEWTDWAHPELRFVAPGDKTASLDAQLAAAAAGHPHVQPTTVVVADDPRRSTQVMFGGHHGEGDALPFPVFVDPYSAQVLGDLPAWSWMPGWSRKIHGGWPLGDAGSWLLELGACWAVVMILTGLYLWWPRQRGFLAALVPRTQLGARILIRDLHGTVAVLFSAILLVFLVSALPWTSFWGNQVLQPVQNLTGQASPFGAVFRVKSQVVPDVRAMSLDEAVARARVEGLNGPLEIGLGSAPDAPIIVRNQLARSSQETAVAFDRYSRALLVKTTWADYPAIPRAVSTGVDLHEGHFFGRANQWFNTITSLALVWISLTGLLSWWLRRPRGGLAAPPRTPVRLPRWVLGVGAGLCLLMPLLGASLAVLWIADIALVRARPAA